MNDGELNAADAAAQPSDVALRRSAFLAGRVVDLCNVIEPHVRQGDFASALALAAAALIHDDRSMYADVAQGALSAAPPVALTLQVLDQWLHDGGSGPAAATRLANIVGHAPVALLRWLDRLLLLSPGESMAEAQWVYGADVICIQLSNADLAAMQLPTELSRFFLVRRSSHRSLAPISRQHIAADFFLPHWHVVPEVPDRGQRGRTVVIGAADEAFAARCAGLAEAGTFDVYLAEFEEPPQFDSRWLDGDAAGWTAAGLLNDAAMAAQARAHLSAALAAGAAVVVFPELTMPAPVSAAVSDWLSEHAQVSDDDGAGLSFVVCGSFHVAHGAAGGPMNRSVVLNRFGDVVRLADRGRSLPFDQAKCTSVDYLDGHGVYEANTKGRELLLGATPMGIHAVAICLDLAQAAEGDRLPWAALPVRWLWAPSLSPQVGAHETQARDLCRQRTVTVACANQAVAEFGGVVGRLAGAAGASFAWGNSGRSSSRCAALPCGPGGHLVRLVVHPDAGTPSA